LALGSGRCDALEDFEPAVIVWIRCVLAGIVLYAVMRLRGGELRAANAELRARPGRAVLLGALAIALPFNLITFGELEVPSGMTAVLIAPASLFVPRSRRRSSRSSSPPC
jgi:drug/metabolite transporter (DMT)-like permease